MKISTLTYAASDIQAIGHLVRHEEGEGLRPGVLVCHEGPGLGDHARQRAEMLGELGYVALAADLYGGGQVAASHEDTVERVTALYHDRNRLRARAAGGLEALRSCRGVDPDRLAAIGYCFGGLAALELARAGARLAGVVTFHGLLDARDRAEARNISASILACTGADDHLVPPEQVAAFEAEMSGAGVDWQVIRFGGARHAFTNRLEADALAQLGFGYHAAADRRAWSAMRGFLAEVFEQAATGRA